MQRLLITIIIMVFLIATVGAGTAAGLLYLDRQEQINKQVELSVEVKNLKDEKDVLKAELDAAEAMAGDDLTCYSQSTDGWLVLNTPCQGQALTPTIKVKGVAFGFFENNVVYELKDGETVVHTGNFTYSAPDLGIPGVIDETITLTIPETFTAINPTLVFYETSAKDGKPLHIVEIELK